jgi:hypothetical protein
MMADDVLPVMRIEILITYLTGNRSGCESLTLAI